MLTESMVAILNSKKDYKPTLSNANTLANSAVLDNPFKTIPKENTVSNGGNNLIPEPHEQQVQRLLEEEQEKPIEKQLNGNSNQNQQKITYQEHMKNKQVIIIF